MSEELKKLAREKIEGIADYNYEEATLYVLDIIDKATLAERKRCAEQIRLRVNTNREELARAIENPNAINPCVGITRNVAVEAERERITKALPEPITDESDDFIKGSNAMLQLVIEAIKNKDTEDMHPMNCDTPYSGSCRHCERAQTAEHDPAICALCDPEYDHLPNKYRNTPSAITTKDEQQQ